MNDSAEINNNLRKNRKESQASMSTVSSASSVHSDWSEDDASKLERKASLQEIIDAAEDKKLQAEYQRCCRSMSDGEAVKRNSNDQHFQVFPSLPDSVLEKLGLRGDLPRERLTEEESEQKFTSLSLAFAIDAATIKDRCERQRRYRDQTERNLSKEIERLKEKLALLQPLCTDIEKAELLSTLLTQIDIVMNATSLVSISAERYGAVQHEDRLTESVNLMVHHVQLLKQQRDSARRQLQYTKRVLQNPQEQLSPASSPTQNQSKPFLLGPNRRVITKRRASIATFSQPIGENNKVIIDVKKFTKRTTDLSLRASSVARNVRPNRLELIGDLDKIKESLAEPMAQYEPTVEVESENESSIAENTNNSSQEEDVPILDKDSLCLRDRVFYELNNFKEDILKLHQTWVDNGKFHEICCICALICFSISLLSLLSILIETEYAKRGWGPSYLFWLWTAENHYDT